MKAFIEIFNRIPVTALLFLSAFFVVAGDFFAKYWSTNQKIGFYIIALIGYLLSGVFYVPSLLREGLVVTAVIWSVLSILGWLLIGLLIFKETLSSWQAVGVVLGVASLIILVFTVK